MSEPSFSERIKSSRFARVLIIYAGISWPILGVAGTLQDALLLPAWVSPATLGLLLAGLVVVLATAWVQSSPLLGTREQAGEVPDAWEIDLQDLLGDLRHGHMPHLTWGRALAGVFFSLWLLFGFAGVYVIVTGGGGRFISGSPAAERIGEGVVVMPFSTSGVDPEVYREGMVSLLSTTLDGVAGLRAIDSRTVLARWREAVGDAEEPDLAAVLDVGREMGARYVLLGSALGTGSRVALVGDLYDLERGTRLGGSRAEGPADSLMGLVDRLSVEAARVLLAQGGEDVPSVRHVASLTTASLPALMAYLEGERLYKTGAFGEAAEAYDRAIRADSTFALASVRAAQVSGWRTGSTDQTHVARALRYVNRLPERERALAVAISDREPAAARIERLERELRRHPDDPDLWEALAELYFHEGPRALQPRARAIAAFERAIELDPSFAPYLIHVTEYAISQGDSGEAGRWLARERRLAPHAWFTRAHAHAFTLAFGAPAARAAVLDTLRSMSWVPWSLFVALRGPHRLEARETALRAAVAADPQPVHLRDLEYTLVNRGRIAGDTLPMVTLRLAQLGLVEPPDPRRFDAVHPVVALYAAATGGLTAAFEERLHGLREMEAAVRGRSEGQAESLAILGRHAVALATLRQDRAAEALPLLEAALAEVRGAHFVGLTLFWLGEAHAALGNEDEALRHFRAAATEEGPQSSLALLFAARHHRRLGEEDEARALYRDLLVAWRDADPYFRPWVEEARGALPDRGE